jgi:acetylornithine deacetylase/succinyl-diaminopimelate desuccinylase-like protein
MRKLTVKQWIVDGYSTMMSEIDDQLEGEQATHVFTPVGVGSFAQAVTSHFRRKGTSTRVIGVEPDTAACLWKSLSCGGSTAIETVPTIMAGLDCGTVSTTAWPILSKGLCASVTVSDYEAHSASLYLKSCGVSAGPCSGSTVAALRRLSSTDRERLGMNSDSVVVLPCTEGARDYNTPLDVATDDPVELTQLLVQINSANPSMGSIPGPGETAIARYIAAWLEHRDLECHWIEPTQGRPSIVGVLRGTGGGRSLMFNGHIDTVTLVGYEKDPLSGMIENGKLYGRGAADMKCGVAAAMVALASSKHLNLRGDVIFAGVADEEDLSIGTEDVLRAGWRADGAIVNEPTSLSVVNAHKGFVWLEVNIHGVASHGSRADLGVDAISKAEHFLAELNRHAQRLRTSRPDSLVGPPTIHASLIEGGEEASSYPANCLITLERRTLVGETASSVENEIRELLENIKAGVEDFEFDVKATASRPAFESSRDGAFCRLVCEEVGAAMGTTPTISPEPYWTDCALLAAEGIPSLLWGPIGEGLHAKEEWADVESIRTVSNALTSIAGKFCK